MGSAMGSARRPSSLSCAPFFDDPPPSGCLLSSSLLPRTPYSPPPKEGSHRPYPKVGGLVVPLARLAVPRAVGERGGECGGECGASVADSRGRVGEGDEGGCGGGFGGFGWTVTGRLGWGGCKWPAAEVVHPLKRSKLSQLAPPLASAGGASTCAAALGGGSRAGSILDRFWGRASPSSPSISS